MLKEQQIKKKSIIKTFQNTANQNQETQSPGFLSGDLRTWPTIY